MNTYLHRVLLTDPPMCQLKDLQDGTYSIEDLMTMHELIDLKNEMSKPKKRKGG